MRNVSRPAALFVAALAVLISGPALAQTVTVNDSVGDGLQGDNLDITAVKVANRDRVIDTTVAVVRVTHGQVGVWISARGDSRRSAVVVGSTHRARGDTSRLLDAQGGVVKCSGLRVTWNESTDRVRARVPSRCFDDGNYGAVKVRAITEIGADADFAPKGPKGNWRWTEWIARG